MNRRWQTLLRERLTAGYGSEDIAVEFGVPVEEVRAEIEAMRKRGGLKLIFGRKTG